MGSEEHCMARHPGIKSPCMHPSGHSGEHRAMTGQHWETCPGLGDPPARATDFWYAYDAATCYLWRWNGPDHKGFFLVDKYGRLDLALKAVPGATFVELSDEGWVACYSVTHAQEGLRTRLVDEWHEYKRDAAAEPDADDIRIYVRSERRLYKRYGLTFGVCALGHVTNAKDALERSGSAAAIYEYADGCSELAWLQGPIPSGVLFRKFKTWHQEHIPPSAAPAVTTFPNQYPDPRPAPTGPCSFCELPAMRWCRDYAVCAAGECNAAEFFHVERLSAGSVDTPETRAEARRYAVIYLADKAEEDAQKKPEGSCAFCPAPAEPQNPECLVAMCAAHERAGWRLTHRLDLGGVSDTPQLRAEVLRHVAASDVFLEEKKRETTGARTHRDHYDQFQTKSYPSLTERQQERPPPEEIPLVGTTPHYEWP